MNRSESRYFATAARMDEAFLTLLAKKDFEYITVKEICEVAEVNRSTFYLHYETMSDFHYICYRCDSAVEDVEEIISKISEDSPYKRRPTQKRTWMTVPEMGKLLGLKKTDRYWLVHKNVFESKEIAGKIRINIASFEKWYANQIKYHKVTGEESGKELKSWSYSVKEVADLLGVDDYLVYELLKKNQIEQVHIWIP